jgi:hypothetical protein
MRRTIKALLLSAVAVLAPMSAVPGTSAANDVTPVKNRHDYRRHDVPHRGYDHHYDRHWDGHPYYRHWDGHPGRFYYYGPDVQVYRYPYRYDVPHRYYDRQFYYRHGGVHVGPLHIGW